MLHPEFENKEYYLNREVSALSFIERVLELAKDKDIPLLEKLRYLCITSTNLDEFFEIRIAGVKEMIASSSPQLSLDGLRADEVFNKLCIQTHEFNQAIYETLNKNILPALTKENIHFLKDHEWNDDIELWARHYFKKEILPISSPIALDLAHPLPSLVNKSLNFIVSLSGKDAFNRNIRYAIVHPPRSIPRFIRLPSELSDNGYYFVYLSDVLKKHINLLFPGMEINGCFAFRITRNSELFFREEEVEDLAVALQRQLFARHYGHSVRLQIDSNCPDDITNFLLNKYQLHREDAYYCNGPVNLHQYQTVINQIKRPDLQFKEFVPQYPSYSNNSATNLFTILDSQDILLHHPYQSFNVFINFLRQAATDPKVYAIKQTLYRISDDSIVVKYLEDAARSGKEVTAIIELRARFDEESNLKLATRLHDAGVMVLYGVVGYKTHAKMTLVVRRVGGKLKNYVHLSTGNYHEETSKLYADYGLLTSKPEITSDIQLIFQQLTGLGKAVRLKEISHAPFTLHKHLLHLIKKCTQTASAGFQAEIFLKINNLTDKSIIQALYEASCAGVKITLVVRSICCLRPSIKHVSENIRVISILGRFLEHHRIYLFKYNKNEELFCASADLMERNLYHRIELMFPILDEVCQKRIKQEIYNLYLKDNCYTWELKHGGHYRRLSGGTFNAQEKLLEKFCNTK